MNAFHRITRRMDLRAAIAYLLRLKLRMMKSCRRLMQPGHLMERLLNELSGCLALCRAAASLTLAHDVEYLH